MSDEVQAGNTEQPAAPAGAENTERPAERMIPKTRFDEVNAKLKELEAWKAQQEVAAMTEAERLAAQAKTAQEAATQAQTALRQARAEAEIAKAAAKAGIDIDLATKIADVRFDDDGKPTGIEASINDALTRWPHLRPQTITVGATNPGRAHKLTMEEIKNMSVDEVAARRCTPVPSVKGRRPNIATGDKVFATLPERVQRTMMGPTRFAMWQRGELSVTPDDVVKRTDSGQWGRGLRIRPLKEMEAPPSE